MEEQVGNTFGFEKELQGWKKERGGGPQKLDSSKISPAFFLSQILQTRFVASIFRHLLQGLSIFPISFEKLEMYRFNNFLKEELRF
jgi:hypothetical protein